MNDILTFLPLLLVDEYLLLPSAVLVSFERTRARVCSDHSDAMAATFLIRPPQPGDGAWLLQQSTKKRSRGRKKVHSFLRNPDEDRNGVEKIGNQASELTFLRPYDIEKERTSSDAAPDRLVPRTIANGKLLSHDPQQHFAVTQPRFASFLRQPLESNYTFESSPVLTEADTEPYDYMLEVRRANEMMAPPASSKALPPHLRGRSTPSPSSEKASLANVDTAPKNVISRDAGETNAVSQAQTTNPVNGAGPQGSKDVDIRAKLASDHGVKVGEAKPVVCYPSSEDEQKVVVKPHGRKAAQSFKERAPRSTRWPKNSDMKPDPHRWDTTWEEPKSFCSSIDSICADPGAGDSKKRRVVPEGIDADTGFRLTDWSGNWAPAPVDWDARPAFRATQSAQQIERWMVNIDADMCGITDWSVPLGPVADEDGTKYTFATKPGEEGFDPMGDLVPRYWIPVVIGRQAPQTFWNDLVKSNAPMPFDEGDLSSAKPWWELYQKQGCNFLRQYVHPEIARIDPDESRDERLARENDRGSNYHTENRKRTEKAKRDAHRERLKKAQEKARKLSETVPAATQQQNKIPPGLNLYLRSAKPADMSRIREIYNWYVDFSVCTPETTRRTTNDMLQRYRDILANKLPFIVACERGGKVASRRKKNMGEDIILPDKVVGFAMADDYNDMQGMYADRYKVPCRTRQC